MRGVGSWHRAPHSLHDSGQARLGARQSFVPIHSMSSSNSARRFFAESGAPRGPTGTSSIGGRSTSANLTPFARCIPARESMISTDATTAVRTDPHSVAATPPVQKSRRSPPTVIVTGSNLAIRPVGAASRFVRTSWLPSIPETVNRRRPGCSRRSARFRRWTGSMTRQTIPPTRTTARSAPHSSAETTTALSRGLLATRAIARIARPRNATTHAHCESDHNWRFVSGASSTPWSP